MEDLDLDLDLQTTFNEDSFEELNEDGLVENVEEVVEYGNEN